MDSLLPRLAVAVYCVALIGFLLWQGLRGLARLRTVVDYLELRERRYPEAKSWKAPLARDAALPFGAIAVFVAGLALIPLLLGVSSGDVSGVSIVVACIGLAGATLVLVLLKRSPWAETRAILWEAASAEGRRQELLEEALATDPQVRDGRV